MLNAICFISVIKNCHCFDLYNILVYVVLSNDHEFCLCQYMAKLFIEGHFFDCIKSMVKFLILRSWSHREQCQNLE